MIRQSKQTKVVSRRCHLPMQKASIELAWMVDFGQEGTDSAEGHPLRRALDILLTEGKPFSRLNLVFLLGDDGIMRWLGALTETRGGRVSFFPGFEQHLGRTEVQRGSGGVPWVVGFDHLTLEADRRTWHTTSPGREEHQGGPSTIDLGEGRVLWFAMSVEDTSVLRTLRQWTSIRLNVPSTDATRRLETFNAARQDAQFSILTPPPKSQNSDESPSFLHLAFVVGPSGFPHYVGSELRFPVGSPYIVGGFPTQEHALHLRTVRARLSDKTDVEIIACRLPAKMRVPVFFSG